jgi:membrane-associated protein
MTEFFDLVVQHIGQLLDILLHLDAHLNEWAIWMGPWIYVLVFTVVFCETGLVVTPFLPGDSLLFMLGAMTVTENAVLSYPILFVGLILSALLGDLVNYHLGRYFGESLFTNEKSKLFNRSYLLKTEKFYEKHGAKTVVMARFVPIVRTFAPFVAGIGKMKFPRFISFGILGSFLWVVIFLTGGRIFGNIPAVKKNFEIVVLLLLTVPALPVVIEVWKARKSRRTIV